MAALYQEALFETHAPGPEKRRGCLRSLHMHQKLSPRTTFCPKVVSGDNDSIDRQDL